MASAKITLSLKTSALALGLVIIAPDIPLSAKVSPGLASAGTKTTPANGTGVTVATLVNTKYLSVVLGVSEGRVADLTVGVNNGSLAFTLAPATTANGSVGLTGSGSAEQSSSDAAGQSNGELVALLMAGTGSWVSGVAVQRQAGEACEILVCLCGLSSGFS